MQTAVISTESAINLNISNQPHNTMNHANPFAFIPGHQSHPRPSPRTDNFRCYEEPGGVMCLEELDVLLEPDVVGGDIVPFVAPLHGQAVPAPTVALFESEAPQPSNVLIESNPPALQTMADEDELVFTPQTSAVCGAEPKLKFRLSGRDFNYSNFEAALLAAVFHGKPPGVLREILTKITTEDFTIVENRIIIEAMLNIHVNGGEVTTSSVLAHLKSTLEGFGPLWIDYVNRCASVAYNPMRISDYIGKLQEASAIRRGDTYTRYSYSEAFCAGLLKFHLPPMKCVGDSWYVYNGGIWELTGRDIFSLEAMESIHPDHRQASHADDLLDHVQRLSQVSQKLFCGAYKRVDDRILINANNRVLDVLPDGSVIPCDHAAEHHFTLKLPTDYDPVARCPEFEATLEYALPDEVDRNLLQVFTGYMLYPGCEFQKALVCFGDGGNGKSTLLEGVGHVFGEFLCSAAGLEDLCKPSGYSLSMMRHTMLNLGSELNGTEIEESANFKKLVSGDTMLTRQIYCKPSLMTATCKLVFLTNHMPRFRGGSHAEMRRLRILRFDRKPPVEDPFLGAKIKAERSGILNWMLDGLAILLQTRAIPRGGDGATMALEALNQSVNPVGAFVADRCKLDPVARVPRQTLLDAFVDWADQLGQKYHDPSSFFFKNLYERYPELKPKGEGLKVTVLGKRLNAVEGIDLL